MRRPRCGIGVVWPSRTAANRSANSYSTASRSTTPPNAPILHHGHRRRGSRAMRKASTAVSSSLAITEHLGLRLAGDPQLAEFLLRQAADRSEHSASWVIMSLGGDRIVERRRVQRAPPPPPLTAPPSHPRHGLPGPTQSKTRPPHRQWAGWYGSGSPRIITVSWPDILQASTICRDEIAAAARRDDATLRS